MNNWWLAPEHVEKQARQHSVHGPVDIKFENDQWFIITKKEKFPAKHAENYNEE